MPVFWKVILGLLLIAGALFALDRLALWMERRGWIYYRRRQGSSSSIGNAMLEIHSMFEGDRRHVLEIRREEKEEEGESGDPPEPGGEAGQGTPRATRPPSSPAKARPAIRRRRPSGRTGPKA